MSTTAKPQHTHRNHTQSHNPRSCLHTTTYYLRSHYLFICIAAWHQLGPQQRFMVFSTQAGELVVRRIPALVSALLILTCLGDYSRRRSLNKLGMTSAQRRRALLLRLGRLKLTPQPSFKRPATIPAALRQTSRPYIEAVWNNFSTKRTTLTEDVFSGRLIARCWRVLSRRLRRKRSAED